MTSITLTNVPDDLLRALREAAEDDGRSLKEEILHLLASALRHGRARQRPHTPEVEAQLRAWRELAGEWKSNVDPAVESEELRQRPWETREDDS